MAKAFLSLGSNIEPRLAYIKAGLVGLDQGRIKVNQVSHLFETQAVDVTDQADFLNIAVEVETLLSPEELLLEMKKIEVEAGKNIERRRGPRTLDLDLLMMGDEVRNTENLTLPHERMHQRAFVLKPLAQIGPELKHPSSGKSVMQMLETLEGNQAIKDLGLINAQTMD